MFPSTKNNTEIRSENVKYAPRMSQSIRFVAFAALSEPTSRASTLKWSRAQVHCSLYRYWDEQDHITDIRTTDVCFKSTGQGDVMHVCVRREKAGWPSVYRMSRYLAICF
jgi:hypothetical protein